MIGQLDDIILVPVGIWLTIKLIPKEVWVECEAEIAMRGTETLSKDWRGVLLVVVIWILLVVMGILLIRRWF